MKSNLPQHPCFNKCSNFRTEQCNTCLIAVEAEFLPGDVVCITEAWRPQNNGLYVFENETSNGTAQVSLYGPQFNRATAIMAGFCVSVINLRSATTAELNARRRLPAPEMVAL